MLQFREIALEDKERANAALLASDNMGCEYSFANNMAWRRLSDSKICFFEDFYIVCAFGTEDGIPSFTFPAGSGDLRELFLEMKSFCRELGVPLRIWGVTENKLKILGGLFPGEFTAEYDRDSSDYIYSRQELAELKGRKFHSKRNHLARFEKLDYVFSPITERDYDDCICFIADTYNASAGYADHSAIAEQFAVNTYFSHFRELELTGGIIRIDGRTAAVTIGERLNSDTFCVHIEKADRRFEGIYAGINNLFVKNCTEGFSCINREEDLGLEGLRKAKLSYNPIFLLNKYTVTFKD
ncbi:MAG: phosphatidylglycerol lysyltransferase domain-containing protein [Alistipes sp.]|nr:phosphatidylglycerol lysyltransferase domain-containing protein [Alistipes sp.]